MFKSQETKRPFPRGVYGITDPELLPEDSLYQGVERALKGGCTIIQYRNKKASKSQQLAEARELARLCSVYNACFIINDDLQLALDCNAHGVHLGKSDGDIAQARRILGPHRYLGVTCHSDIEYAKDAIKKGVDYCAFGRFFPSKTKPDAPHSPLSLLSEIIQLPIPTLAIGGITVDNMSQLMDTSLNNQSENNSLNNIAVIHGLFGQSNIEKAATALSEKFFSLS